MSDYGFKVAKITKDIKTATADDLELASNAMITRIDRTIIFQFNITGGASYPYPSVVTTVAHNLGYKPFFEGMYSVDNNNWFLPQTSFYCPDTQDVHVAFYTDATNLKCYCYLPVATTKTVYCKVYLYADGV